MIDINRCFATHTLTNCLDVYSNIDDTKTIKDTTCIFKYFIFITYLYPIAQKVIRRQSWNTHFHKHADKLLVLLCQGILTLTDDN